MSYTIYLAGENVGTSTTISGLAGANLAITSRGSGFGGLKLSCDLRLDMYGQVDRDQITVFSGGYAYNTSLCGCTMYIQSGGTATDTVATLYKYYYNTLYDSRIGVIDVYTGGTANGVTIGSGCRMAIASGGKLTGLTAIHSGANVQVYNGTIIDFHIATLIPGGAARITGLSYITGWENAVYTLTVSGSQTDGSYTLATDAAGFNKTITVKNSSGLNLGTLKPGQTVNIGGQKYTLLLSGAYLKLTIGPIDTIAPSVQNIQVNLSPDSQHLVVTADFTDDNKLVSSLYRIGESGAWTDYVDCVTVSESTTVFFKAVDAAGNESPVVSRDITFEKDTVISSGQTATCFPSDFYLGTILSGGTMYVSSGGMPINTKIESGGTMYVSSGGVANTTTVNSGGHLDVSSGGTASNTTVNWGLHVSSGGTAVSTTVNSDGGLYIGSGGSADHVTVKSGGELYVIYGGSATNIDWTPCAGHINIGSRLGGRETYISDDGIKVTFTSQYSGVYYGVNDQLLSHASVMESKKITSGGTMYVMSGGTANNIIVTDGWDLAWDDTLKYGLFIWSGGTANNAFISSGYMYVRKGGTANGTVVDDAGCLHVCPSGIINNTTLNFRGHLYVAGGTANGITFNNFCKVFVYDGGVARNAALRDTSEMEVFSGGTADKIRILSGGSLSVSSDGSATNIDWTPFAGTLLYEPGAYLTFSTNLSGVYYGSNDQLVSRATIIDSKTISSGGTMYVMSDGTAKDTDIKNLGELHVFSGGTADSATVNSGGIFHAFSGGTAKEIRENGGYVYVNEGANVTFTPNAFFGLILSGTSATVHSGTTANSTTVNTWGYLYISSGGTANSTTVVNYGNMYVFSGGTANSTTVNSKGVIYVSSGGTANSTTVVNYGNMYVFSGGTANSTTVNSKGAIYVSSGGKLTGQTTVASGAYISAYDGAILDFDISNLAPGAAARINNLSRISGWENAIFTLTVNGTQTNGTYTLAEGASKFNKAISIKNTSGESLGTIKVGKSVMVGSKEYTLNLNDDVLSVTVSGENPPPVPTCSAAKSDIDGNGVSDVMFVWTGYNYAHGYWMNGDANDWQSTYAVHPAEWENLGCYDMNGDGKADSVLVGNIELQTGKGAYIGYYLNGEDTDANWVNIDYLNNEAGVVWKNKVCNLTGNANSNSIIWYAPDMYTLGAWIDGTSQWALLNGSFGTEWWKMAGCGDFDGDGKDSVLMSGYDCKFLYSVGLDGVAHSHGSTNWWGWEVRAIGDFAGDGKDDIVLFHSSLGAIVMLVDGNADDYVSLGQLDPNDWFVVGAGDYNGDRKDDLLVRQKSTGMLGYYNACDTSETGWVEMGRGVDLNWTVIA